MCAKNVTPFIIIGIIFNWITYNTNNNAMLKLSNSTVTDLQIRDFGLLFNHFLLYSYESVLIFL